MQYYPLGYTDLMLKSLFRSMLRYLYGMYYNTHRQLLLNRYSILITLYYATR